MGYLSFRLWQTDVSMRLQLQRKQKKRSDRHWRYGLFSGSAVFIQKSAAEKHNIAWFEKDLVKLFKHGVHEFYTYPEEAPADKKSSEKQNTEKSEKNKKNKKNKKSDSDLVQMVKAE